MPPDYVRSLDDSAQHKAQLFGPWIDALALGPDDVLVDMGCGTGALAARLAAAPGGPQVRAFDADPAMVRLARERHGRQPGLSFELGDACTARPGPARAWILSSVLHELHAEGGPTAVAAALARAAEALQPRGRLLVRDFVRPFEADRRVVLRHARDDIVPGRSFADLAAGARFPVHCDGCEETADEVRYRTDLAGAFEYLFRKDCGRAWQAELAQRYGFWGRDEAIAAIQRTGLALRHAEVRINRWVIDHRLRGRVALHDALTGEPVDLPLTQILLVADARPHGVN